MISYVEIVSSTTTQTSNQPESSSATQGPVSQTIFLSPPQSTVQAPSTTSQGAQPSASLPM